MMKRTRPQMIDSESNLSLALGPNAARSLRNLFWFFGHGGTSRSLSVAQEFRCIT